MLGQIIRFSLTGLVNTLVDFGLFNLLLYGSRVEEGWWLLLFNLLATGGAALNSYFMNSLSWDIWNTLSAVPR